MFRGNIRQQINQHKLLAEFVNEICGTDFLADDEITIAIDTPLGLPIAVANLITGGDVPRCIPETFSENPYLYRRTERWLCSKGFSPLSSIKEMIGSQSTKVMT